jgi:DNA polymerase
VNKLYIDFESYSEAKLKNVGAWAYSRHPSTKVLIMAWAFDNEAPVIWTPGEPLPLWHNRLSAPSFQLNAWDDFFELCLMRNVLKWPVPPPRYWADTAAKAAALALPRGLGACGEALGLPMDRQKSKAGEKLIQLFCKPRVSTRKGSPGLLVRTRPEDEPEKFMEFKRYCLQDVIAEREIDRILPELQPRTRALWELDRKINLRGLHFDMPAVKDALVIIEKARAKAAAKISDNTAGMLDNIASRPQLLEYLDQIGTPLESAQKEYLKRKLAELEKIPDKRHAAGIIRMRLEVSRSSLAKYDKMVDVVDDTSRAYGLLRFHGASTGRWSGNLIQPQNFPRKSLDMPDLCIDLFRYQDPEILELLFDDSLEAISYCLRGMITASPGNRLVVSDFSQIESRVLAWLAGAVEKLEAYTNKMDIYVLNAMAAFKIRYYDVDKEQRQIGKVIELACGYGGGLNAFKSMAQIYGVVIPDNEAAQLIKNWRLGNPKITSYWSSIESLAVAAVKEPGSLQRLRNVGFKVKGSGNTSFLFCILPSGRVIAYHRPRLVEGNFNRPELEYWGVDSQTKKYTRQHTYGGKLVENITQAVAMDVMADKMIEIEPYYPIVLTAHDEVVSDTKNGVGNIEDFNRIMVTVPDWAKGLPIAADGYEAHRYKK